MTQLHATPFAGLIFDFNGVLWWDSHLQETAWQQFSESIRGTPFTAEEMAVHVHGRNNRYTLQYATGRSLTTNEIDHLTQRKETIYRQLCLDAGDAFQLSPGAIDLLNYLVSHQIPHTIATASEKSNLDFFIHHLNLAHWFDLSQIVYDDGHRPGKPAPDIYLEAAQRLELPPEKCVVIEDAVSGIEAAHQAGIGYIIGLEPAGFPPRLHQLTSINSVIPSLVDFPRQHLFGTP